jgi:hypothetical protein
MKELTRFRRWANSHRPGRGLLCHFYTVEGKKQKQYYTKPDYAYFNMFSNSPDWIVKGTTGHGICSERGKVSSVPCLNCYKVNDAFYEGLETLLEEGNKKYELGLLLDKSALKRVFEVIDVLPWNHKGSRPPPPECWKYDIPTKKAALYPFNYCDVVRIRIPFSRIYDMPIAEIPGDATMGILVKEEGYDENALAELYLKKWEDTGDMGDFRPFPLL